MSGEILLLMLVFSVLPLIEQAIKNARQKRDGGAAAGRKGPPPRQAPRPARTAPPRAPEPFDEDEDEEDDEPAWVARPPVPPPLPPAPRQAPRPAPSGRRAAPPAEAPSLPAEVLMAQRARLTRLAASALPELAAGAARRQRRVRLPELRRPDSLKRAIVLQAVLGPCRANDPHA